MVFVFLIARVAQQELEVVVFAKISVKVWLDLVLSVNLMNR